MNHVLCRVVVPAVGVAALLGFAGAGSAAAQVGAMEIPRPASVSTLSPSPDQPRFASGAQESTVECGSPIECRRQAVQYAKQMQAQGYSTQVYSEGAGRKDTTVEVFEKGDPKKKVVFIRHFVAKGKAH